MVDDLWFMDVYGRYIYISNYLMGCINQAKLGGHHLVGGCPPRYGRVNWEIDDD
jgi:hypothetical protein